MKDFDRLTHLGKGRRLRPLVGKVLRRFGIGEATLSQFHETINMVFRIRAVDGERYLLRMTPPWHFHGAQDVHSEIAWIRAIGDETDIGVPAPVPDARGERVLTDAWPGIPGEWHCVLFSWIPGGLLADKWTRENIRLYGQLLAMLHEQGSTFAPPADFRIRTYSSPFPHCDPDFEKPEPLVLFDGVDEKLMPPARKEVFLEVRDRTQEEIRNLFASGTPQPIHNDLHPWNVMVSRGRLYAIDFENCLLGFPVQDVGTTLHYVQQHFEKKIPFGESEEMFRLGYETVRAWPEQHPGQIDAMMAAHRLMLCNFYAASKDPEYQEFAVGYIEVMEKRLRDYLEGAVR